MAPATLEPEGFRPPLMALAVALLAVSAAAGLPKDVPCPPIGDTGVGPERAEAALL